MKSRRRHLALGAWPLMLVLAVLWLNASSTASSAAPDREGAQLSAAVAFDGTNYLVVWEDRRLDPVRRRRLRRAREPGRRRARPGGIAISTAAEQPGRRRGRLRRHELPRRLAGLPRRHELRHLRRARQPGRRRARPGRDRDLDGGGRQQAARASPSTARTTSSPGRTAAPASHLRHLRRARQPGRHRARPGRDSRSRRRRTSRARPRIAFDGTNYLVAWEDNRSGSTTTSTARASARPGPCSTRPGSRSRRRRTSSRIPRVAFDGTNHLVAW